MSNDIALEIKNVSVSYRVKKGAFSWAKYTPIKDMSLQLFRGETVGVIGRNGAGKSTLLRLLAGIIAPDSGVVINNGVKVSLLALGVGFLPHLSGRENAIMSGMLMGLRRNEISNRIDNIIEFSGLDEFIDRPLHTYSSGMRARLGFSTAIQADPDVLLIDEILGVGDEDFRAKSTTEMRRLIDSEKTIVLVSHVMPVIRSLCKRVIWIEGERIKECGGGIEVTDRYLKIMNKKAE